MEIRPVASEQLLGFLRAYAPFPGLFLQTPAWLSVEASRGLAKAEQLGLWAGGTLVGVTSVVFRTVGGAYTYAYSPRGPAVAEAAQLAPALACLKRYCRGRACFIRVEPIVLRQRLPQVPYPARHLNGFRRVYEYQPRATVVLDLTKSDDELKQAMHHKTRYNIGLGERQAELTFRLGSERDFDSFWRLIQATADRSGFAPHTYTHYHTLVARFGHEPLSAELAARLGVIECRGEVVAACLNVASLGVMTYLYGASTRGRPELKAPHLLHWRMVHEAKAAGLAYYDFWGVKPSTGRYPAWEGFTRFKLGFGGTRVEYLGTYDYPLQPALYGAYRLMSALHRWVVLGRRALRRRVANRTDEAA